MHVCFFKFIKAYERKHKKKTCSTQLVMYHYTYITLYIIFNLSVIHNWKHKDIKINFSKKSLKIYLKIDTNSHLYYCKFLVLSNQLLHHQQNVYHTAIKKTKQLYIYDYILQFCI